MHTVKVSSKRQVTFPKRVCQSLGIGPGDELELERRVEGDEERWYLKLPKGGARPWLGALKDYAPGRKHDMESIRTSIARGRGAGDA